MTHWTRGVLHGLAVLGAGMVLAGGPAAAAQPTTGFSQDASGDALSRNLKMLAANPRSVDALTGAGRAALQVGDAQAALGFLARAEDESPRDGRIKMWIGTALVQLEQPHAAIKFFKDAAELGIPEAEFAGDRGLAYDILGDQRRAQRDYRLALQRARTPDIVCRLALSLAISGEREQALRTLDEQLDGRGPAADRTRALVLALTGDAADAARVVEASMPGGQGAALMPFLARLPALSPADRALAVHLGHFPQDGRTAPASGYAMNEFRSNVVSLNAGTGAPPVDAGRPDPRQPALGRSTASLVRAAPAQASDDVEEDAPPVRTQPVPERPQPVAAPPPVRRQPGAASAAPVRVAGSAQPTDWSLSRPALPRVHPRVSDSRPRPEPAAAVRAPVLALAHPLDTASPPPPAEDVAAPVRPAAGHSRLADLAATVATLPGPVVPPVRAAAYGPKVPHSAPAAGGAKKPPVPVRKAEPKEAARHWVQLGIGDDEETLPGEYKRLRAKAGKLLATRAAWTAPMGETNRILVGPFPSKDEARDFVNELAEKKLKAFAWTSPAGEKVAKLPAK
ncbi:MAG: SPOR domain-containing protein [Alphaproteobacteria bacterium]|nr:SPOR domain-containing protein [Alphaproteobacteria bacterium]